MNTENVNESELKEETQDVGDAQEKEQPHDAGVGQEAPAEETADTEETAEGAAEESSEEVQEDDTDWQDKYLRLYAEFDNFRKRTMRERGDLIRNASMDVLEKLLPVLDDFDRASANPSDDVEVTREGQNLIHTKLRQLLEAQGLTKMEVNQGDDFDVDVHEAITNIPAPTPELAGKVVDVVEPGYKLNDKIMRYAKVVVGQ